MPAPGFYADGDEKLVTNFRNDPKQDHVASQKEGYPVYVDRIVVDILMPADRQSKLTVPADSVWMDGITYAERFSEAYKRFMAGATATINGTPLAEAPFLSEAQRSSLRALDVYTVQQLAGLEGKPLQNLGVRGREMQQQATAYLERATGTQAFVALSNENASLKAQLEALQSRGFDHDGDGVPGGVAPANPDASGYQTMTKDELRELIKNHKMGTGKLPVGNPNNENLIGILEELDEMARTAA